VTGIKRFRRLVGIWRVRGKSSSYFVPARIHIITFRVAIQFKTCCAVRLGALAQAFFSTAQIVEREFIYKIKYACEIIIDTLIVDNSLERW